MNTISPPSTHFATLSSTQLLSATLPLLTLLLTLLLIKHLSQSKLLPPGPPSLPLLPNLPLLLSPNLHLRLAHLSLTYGPIMRLHIGTKLWIVITSPKIAKQIFTEHDVHFSNHEQPLAATIISYNGSNLVRCPYGPTWRVLRRVFVQELVNAKSVEILRREMRRAVRGILARQGESIDVGELVFGISVDMLVSMLCGGEERGRWGDEGEEFRRVVKETVELLGRPNVSDYLPWVSWFDLQGIERGMRRRVAWLDGVYDGMIEERMRKGKCGDLLSRLLRIRDGEDSRFKLSDVQVKGLMMDFLVGGTTGAWTTIEWLMAELIHRPETYHRALAELDAVVGRHRAVEESDIPHLPYLRSLIKETLRLHSVIPLLVPRVPLRPIVVSGYLIPAGARVVTNVWAIQNDPNVWDKPHEFRPERFLPGNEGESVAGGFGFFPFGAGRRKCAGLPLAERMLPFVAASLLQLFEWRVKEGERKDLNGRSGVTLSKEKPLLAVAVARFPACKEMYE